LNLIALCPQRQSAVQIVRSAVAHESVEHDVVMENWKGKERGVNVG
jgi:hypothetical protein